MPSFEAYAGRLPQDLDVLRAAWIQPGPADGVPTRILKSPARQSRPAPAEDLPEGRRLGDYALLRELGRGGMGVVYQARQLSLNRLVALKMIKDSQFASHDELLRFQNEARIVATRDHPHLVPIFDVGALEGQHGFSMKLIEGGSLSQRLADYAAAPAAAAALVITVAEAVHHAHQRGILHRDLKPSNILLDDQGHPHITDFGLAKRLDEDNELSRSGTVVGTPSYMAPEQALGQGRSTTTTPLVDRLAGGDQHQGPPEVVAVVELGDLPPGRRLEEGVQCRQRHVLFIGRRQPRPAQLGSGQLDQPREITLPQRLRRQPIPQLQHPDPRRH